MKNEHIFLAYLLKESISKKLNLYQFGNKKNFCEKFYPSKKESFSLQKPFRYIDPDFLDNDAEENYEDMKVQPKILKDFFGWKIIESDYHAINNPFSNFIKEKSLEEFVKKDWIEVEGNRISSLNLEDKNLQGIPGSVLNLTGLKYLYLNNNQISSISPSIKDFKELIGLDISYNKIKELPDEIYYLENLEFLNLKGNSLNKETKGELNFFRTNSRIKIDY